MSWILIIIAFGYGNSGAAISHVGFPSADLCQIAAKQVVSQEPQNILAKGKIDAVCVKVSP